MKTAKEFLQNKYPQMRGEKWNSNEVINDEWIAQMIEEYASQPKWVSDEEIEEMAEDFKRRAIHAYKEDNVEVSAVEIAWEVMTYKVGLKDMLKKLSEK